MSTSTEIRSSINELTSTIMSHRETVKKLSSIVIKSESICIENYEKKLDDKLKSNIYEDKLILDEEDVKKSAKILQDKVESSIAEIERGIAAMYMKKLLWEGDYNNALNRERSEALKKEDI